MGALRELADGTLQKQCSRCDGWKRIPEGFGIRLLSSDGFESWCRTCQAEKDRNYHAAHPRLKRDDKSVRRNYATGYSGKFFSKF